MAITAYTDGNLKELKEDAILHKQLGWLALIARLEAAEGCADALDANRDTIAENSDEDDLAIVDHWLKTWRKAAGK